MYQAAHLILSKGCLRQGQSTLTVLIRDQSTDIDFLVLIRAWLCRMADSATISVVGAPLPERSSDTVNVSFAPQAEPRTANSSYHSSWFLWQRSI